VVSSQFAVRNQRSSAVEKQLSVASGGAAECERWQGGKGVKGRLQPTVSGLLSSVPCLSSVVRHPLSVPTFVIWTGERSFAPTACGLPPPACAGGAGLARKFLADFRFVLNIQASRNVYDKNGAAGGGGRRDRAGRTNETSPSQKAVVGSR
jgi:hypothetical protein